MSEQERKRIGAKLMKERIRQGWSLYRAAKETGMQIHQVKAIEAGERNYTIDGLLAYAKALGITININIK